MADVAEAIAAAMAAAAASSTSPPIKTEPPTSDLMVLDRESEPPPSPIKRARTPDEDDEQSRDEKRLKLENEGVNDIDDIALLVQQAEASVMQQFHSEYPTTEDMSCNDDHFHDITHDISHDMSHDMSHDISHDIHGMSHELPHDLSHDTSHSLAGLEHTFEPEIPSPVENPEPRPESLWSNPRDFTRRKHIIPGLGSMAIDIITAWSEQSLEDTIATLSGDTDSDIAREYTALKTIFDNQRKLLSDTNPLLYSEQLSVTSQTREVIRIVNLATTCASVFGGNELGLEEINDHFLRIFVPNNQEVPRDVAELYLGLKTQMFLSVLESEPEKAREQLLDDLFITKLESFVQEHHPNTPLTTPEHEFVTNAKTRKAMLLNESTDAESIQALSKQFTYEAFLDSLSTFFNDHIEEIREQGTVKAETASNEDIEQEGNLGQSLDDTFDLNAMIAEASRAAQSALEPINGDSSHELDELSAFLAENVSKAVEQAKESATSTELPSAIASAAESASRATMLALQSIQQNQYQPTALPQSYTPTHSTSSHNNHQSQQIQQIQQTHQTQQPQPQPYYSNQQQQQATMNGIAYQTPTDNLPPNQSEPTPTLYERARQAAAARSSTHARREGSHSTRRPWSPEEEKALMMGLDMVKGPHWSQILTLFGPNGSVSRILADRTQVQLKDKARNLKLFFLKTNSEMPYYLQCVTGELKTRAPTQAARKEAEEKARLNSEEQQAHVNGILTLAGGLQNNAVSRQSPSATIPRSATPNQPLSHPNSQPGTPRVAHQQIQPSAATLAPLPRPVIPAPQPVSLPTLTSTALQHMQLPPPQAERPVTPATSATPPAMTSSTTSAPTAPSSSTTTMTVAPMESIEPKHEMNSVDAAVLGLGAALQREREMNSAATSAVTAHAEEARSVATSATPAATSI